MQTKSYRYAALTVDVVNLAPNERFTFRAGTAANGIGAIYVRGVIAPVGDDACVAIAEHRQWRPRAAWSRWPDAKDSQAEAMFQAGPDGAQWVCLSRNGSGERTVEHRIIDGGATVPAGWGFVVASGRIVLDGQAGEIGNYFAPRETDVAVSGCGDMLLVR